MKKSIYMTLAFCATLFFSNCSKEDPEPKPDCEVNKYASITISNTSDNPYDIKVDGVKKLRIAGKGTEKINIAEGNGRALLAVQASGYLITPTEKLRNINVISCSEYSWQIP